MVHLLMVSLNRAFLKISAKKNKNSQRFIQNRLKMILELKNKFLNIFKLESEILAGDYAIISGVY